MYWWRVIHSMKVEYDNARIKGEGSGDGPVKRQKGGPRRKPVLPSQQKRNR